MKGELMKILGIFKVDFMETRIVGNCIHQMCNLLVYINRFVGGYFKKMGI